MHINLLAWLAKHCESYQDVEGKLFICTFQSQDHWLTSTSVVNIRMYLEAWMSNTIFTKEDDICVLSLASAFTCNNWVKSSFKTEQTTSIFVENFKQWQLFEYGSLPQQPNQIEPCRSAFGSQLIGADLCPGFGLLVLGSRLYQEDIQSSANYIGGELFLWTTPMF